MGASAALSKAGMRCHVVIPAYNEGARLPRYLRSLAIALREADFGGEILVVDDGSLASERAKISASINEIREGFPFVVGPLCLPCNRGKGHAVRAGWTAANPTAGWVLFADADGAVSAAEVVRLLAEIQRTSANSVDAWFGSRIKMRGRHVTRSWRRHLSGRLFATLVACYIDDHIYDSQCGLKAIRADVWRTIAPSLREDRFAFDVELLAALNAAGARVSEFPVDWHDQAGSKVSVVRDGLRMAWALRRIRNRFVLRGKRESQ